MARLAGFIAAVAALLLAAAAPGRAAAELPCNALADIDLPHAKVTKASVESLGETKACRFSVTAKPTVDSDIRIEVWIPIGGAWNGRYVQLGNGGFAGSIRSDALKAMAARGYATAATDDGHQAAGTDASWALGHPEKVVDFGWRALKETTDAAKTLVLALKGSGPARSYFTGCSDGGREALMEAQRFPSDFDGIVAGAPAYDFNRLLATSAWAEQALARPGAYIPPPKLTILQAAALRQCADGGAWVADPAGCRFDPVAVLCRPGQDPAGCLSAEQVAAARAIYAGPRRPDGLAIYPGYTAGAEAEPGGWALWITGPSPARSSSALSFQFSSNYFRYMAVQDPRFDILSLDFGAGFDAARARTTAAVDAVNPDLRAFRAHGGRLIQYHGWNDAAIPALGSVAYYEDVRRTMGDPSGFYRLYMVPGMLHCGGGPGPGAVDWLGLVQAWAERDDAPGALVATNEPSPFAPPGPPPAERLMQPLCPWPAVARAGGCASAAPPPRARLRGSPR